MAARIKAVVPPLPAQSAAQVQQSLRVLHLLPLAQQLVHSSSEIAARVHVHVHRAVAAAGLALVSSPCRSSTAIKAAVLHMTADASEPAGLPVTLHTCSRCIVA